MTLPANSKNQRQRILDLLMAAHGRDVPSVALSRVSLQYGARVKELREMGCRITNRTERCAGKVYGYFRLESGSPSRTQEQQPVLLEISETRYPD